ncbi:MAG: sugar transferase [Oscillospiraceae bacterium]|nr:sugar transferase [Oscillospiraceae bacterium]
MEANESQAPFRRISPPGRATLAAKRAFDVVFAALGLLVTSPILLLAAAAVGLSSPGGVLFCQKRIGRGEKPFTIYKFRSMRKDNAGLKITTGSDARITPVGRVLRKTKVDELPQLWNVLKGDMSFVGPRPEVEEYTRLYTPQQRQIFLVRPGITDPASIAYRNENELLTGSDDPNRTYVEEIMPRKIELGLAYIEQISLGYDIRLICRTLLAVVKE